MLRLLSCCGCYCYCYWSAALLCFCIHSAASQSEKDLVPPNEMHLDGVPKFLKQPNLILYTMKGRPAKVECIAEPVSHASIHCAEKDYPYMPGHADKNRLVMEKFNAQGQPDDNGQRWKYSLMVKTKEVEEWFEKYICYCIAWNLVPQLNGPKKVESDRVLIKEAYLDEAFEQVPKDMMVEGGKTISLSCKPPSGEPEPEVFWQKNGQPLDVRLKHLTMMDKNDLIIHNANVQDSGNYSCVAASLGISRHSAVAQVTIYVNGGWSSWSAWTPCPAVCRREEVCAPMCVTATQSRHRDCLNPVPQNGGRSCAGSRLESALCESSCIVHGGWSSWSSWSDCDISQCSRKRIRHCDSPTPRNGGSDCESRPTGGVQFANCSAQLKECFGKFVHFQPRDGSTAHQDNNPSGGQRNIHEMSLYVGVLISVAIFIAIVILIILIVRKKFFQHASLVLRYSGDALYQAEKTNKKINELLLPPLPANSLSSSTATATAPPGTIVNMSISQHHPGTSTSPGGHGKTNKHGGGMATSSYASPCDYSTTSLGGPLLGNLCLPPAPQVPYLSSSTYTTIDGDTIANPSTATLVPPMLGGHFVPMASSSRSNLSKHAFMSGGGSGTDVDSQPYHEVNINNNSDISVNSFIPGHLDMDAVAWATLTHVGGRLSLHDLGVSLTIPPGALLNTQVEDMFLAVCHDANSYPKLTDKQTLLSPILICGPTNMGELRKPVIFTLPHCASLKHGGWDLKVLSSSGITAEEQDWQEVIAIGRERLQARTYCQVDPLAVHIMYPRMGGHFCLVGSSTQSQADKAVKLLRLAAFAGPFGLGQEVCVRIYVMSDTRHALFAALHQETRLGAQLLDTSKQLLFRDNGLPVCFCIEELAAGWRSRLQNKYQEIPFSHVWSGRQSHCLYCSFTLENTEPQRAQQLQCKIACYQEQNYVCRQMMNIACDMSTLGSGSHTNPLYSPLEEKIFRSTSPLNTQFRLSAGVRSKLCKILDTPHFQGHDWRMIANLLGVDRFIHYFACQSSPSEAILDLWEARHREEDAASDLKKLLASLNRKEINKIIVTDSTFSRL